MASSRSQSAQSYWPLLLALAGEVAIFSLVAPNFFTVANLFEVTRFSVELGLLAVALTPIIVAAGIDLSVGSMMGLAAVVFGAAHRDWQLSVPLAALVTLLLGCAGGALNARLIAGLNLPPLIVTLASFSLFRGVAEGMTGGAINYTAFPIASCFSVKCISSTSCRRSCRCSSRSSSPTHSFSIVLWSAA